MYYLDTINPIVDENELFNIDFTDDKVKENQMGWKVQGGTLYYKRRENFATSILDSNKQNVQAGKLE